MFDFKTWLLKIRGRILARRPWIFSILVLVTLALGAGFYKIQYENRKSPVVSFAAIKLSIALQSPWIRKSFVDSMSVTKSVSTELVTQLTPSNSPQESAQQVMARQVFIQLASSLLPLLIESKDQWDQSHSNQDLSKQLQTFQTLIPLLLRIPLNSMDQWFNGSQMLKWKLGICRQENHRAACEWNVQGPDEKSATLVLLWEQDGLFWKLKGVLGLSQLLEEMRR